MYGGGQGELVPMKGNTTILDAYRNRTFGSYTLLRHYTRGERSNGIKTLHSTLKWCGEHYCVGTDHNYNIITAIKKIPNTDMTLNTKYITHSPYSTIGICWRSHTHTTHHTSSKLTAQTSQDTHSTRSNTQRNDYNKPICKELVVGAGVLPCFGVHERSWSVDDRM